MFKSRILPCEAEIEEDGGEFSITLEGVVFTEAWGPFEKGDVVDSLTVDLVEGTIEEWTLEGEKKRGTCFKLQAVLS